MGSLGSAIRHRVKGAERLGRCPTRSKSQVAAEQSFRQYERSVCRFARTAPSVPRAATRCFSGQAK